MTLRPRKPHVSHWGFSYDAWTEGRAEISCALEPRHLNPSGTVHGGVLLTLMDEAGAMAGLFVADPTLSRHSVTVSLTGQFVGQAHSGRIVVVGTLVGSGQRIYFSRTEVTGEDGQVLAFGSSTHRYRRSVPAGVA